MDFYAFTKSMWDEAPRLRHQVASLIAGAGHEILFFQKPTLKRRAVRTVGPHLHTVGTRYAMHQQLRFMKPLSVLNAAVEKAELRRAAPEPPRIGILNFNYDYEFLREVYPDARIVTLINDDFIDGARWFSRRETTRALAATARMSDRCVAVSFPLVDQLRAFTDRVDLFLPWSRSGYTRPPAGLDRPDVLYWGYINDRIDAVAVRHVLESGVRVHFVGPVIPSPKVASFLDHPNVSHRPAASLAELREIIDRCCASLLPYDINFKQVAAITINNRAFEILSFGLPLLYSDLPGLIDSPPGVIYRNASPEAYVEAIRSARVSFDAVQPVIEQFLEGHTGRERYTQLMSYFQ